MEESFRKVHLAASVKLDKAAEEEKRVDDRIRGLKRYICVLIPVF